VNELLAQAAEEEAKGGDFSNSELAFTDSQMHKGIEF